MSVTRPLADPQRDGTLFVCDLSRPVEVPMLPGVQLRAGTPDDAEAIEDAMHDSGDYDQGVVAERLRDGRRPYIAACDDRVVSYGWIAYTAEPIGDLGLSFRLRSDEAYIYDCATRPAYRGRGLYPALLRTMAAALQTEGRSRVWIGTAPGNVVSQRGIARAGFAKVADVHFSRRPDGSFHADLYGVPGIPLDLLERAAWSFHGRAHPDTGLPMTLSPRDV